MDNKEIAAIVKILLDRVNGASSDAKHKVLLQVLIGATVYAYQLGYSPDEYIKAQTQSFEIAMARIDSILDELNLLNKEPASFVNKDLN